MSAPGYNLRDVRPVAAEAPYTFFLPSAEQLEAIIPGDLVQVTVEAVPQSEEWDAERIWFRIKTVADDRLVGQLASEPDDIPALKPGDEVAFQRHHVIDCIFEADRDVDPPSPPRRRTYWERCLVDECVTVGGDRVHYLYREEPEVVEGDTYPDSGWRIRGDYRTCTDEELASRKTEFVALARALNSDDSWIHLIDEPIGSEFIRDWESGLFERYEADPEH